MTVEYARKVRPDLVPPFIGHWATYAPGAHAGLLGRTGRKEFPVVLRVVDDRLTAFYEDLERAVLAPSSRDFFDRTMRRVSELGGEAQAFAEEHGGALKVFVEDDAPVRPGPGRGPARQGPRSRPRSSGVSMSYASATSAHSTSVSASRCSRR
ncbi:hypothetical protein OG599_28610 [Streptomyces sp. NBC_01335]|uniref:hypothetical protein n=1 Tax=Streptomyces sp. NBC_01335 TaxID=2903828 RepID=UPI002E132B12|nr:hypothetical protein OG599_28610 [Streptomyces sp. NBC_01335]